ncbi:RraA-like protein [Jaminaea rosea]|uniref:RraA-like protein n=1 Tax=Jaminaea rosea TaxID=1569628 RepID=A0A316UIE8_9BASI|nr:RraA-like protein [Jaminaea rosea]PWN24694.1 RraA-like protein [Jaminaea rosea]
MTRAKMVSRRKTRTIIKTKTMKSTMVNIRNASSKHSISDALIKLKHPTGGHIPSLSLVSPRDSVTAKLCGQVFPVRMVASSDKNAPPKPSTHFVDAAPKDSVMLVTAPDNVRSAVWGGLMTARAQAKGVKGVVLNGNCRDLAEHWESITIFAKGHSTLGQSPFTRPATLGEPIEIRCDSNIPPSDADPAWPTMTVQPSDILLADVDGVVVVPRKQVAEVVELTKKGREVDARCLEDLKQGKGVAETFKKHRGA